MGVPLPGAVSRARFAARMLFAAENLGHHWFCPAAKPVISVSSAELNSVHSASSGNTFGDNTARGNLGSPTCTTAAPGACALPDFCDSGAGNTSFGTNLMPGPC